MISTKLDELGAAIAAKNTYFDNHFSDVVFDETTGYILSDQTPAFPNDTLGNYFYLRSPRNWGFQSVPIADGVVGTNVSGQVILVAYMRDADPDKLAANLINTIRGLSCSGHDVALLSATAQAETVILQELANLSAENQETALQRIGENVTLVSVTFTYNTDYPYSTCIVNPCLEC